MGFASKLALAPKEGELPQKSEGAMKNKIARLRIIGHLRFFGKAYNPLNKLVKGVKKIMFNKQWAIVLLVFGAYYFFDLLKKILSGVHLPDAISELITNQSKFREQD